MSLAIVALAGGSAAASSVDESVDAIRAVGKEGQGNAQAAKAVQELAKADSTTLPTILKGFAGAGPVAENWLRGAVEAIVDRTIAKGEKLPAAEMEQFILDRSQNPKGRRLAYECLLKVDDSVSDRIVPQLLQDPNREFRRDAVARVIEQAKTLHNQNKKEEAIEAYQRALTGAVDDDQVKLIINPLGKLGVTVDLPRHFGFLTKWHVIGPFDNRKGIGFKATYPPEEAVDLAKTHDGQLGEVKWEPLSTEDRYGLVDIAKSIKNYKGAVMYAYTTFDAAQERDVEIRLGTPNAWALWVNGKRVFGREEYHRGFALDQFRVGVKLNVGENAILLKLCQNENDQDWAQRYQFELRVCDQAGAAVHPKANDRTANAE
jgi:hypothetical protein